MKQRHLEDSVSVAMLLPVVIICCTLCFALRKVRLLQVHAAVGKRQLRETSD
jgi:hypothetical protein